jgi:hypothetical protein
MNANTKPSIIYRDDGINEEMKIWMEQACKVLIVNFASEATYGIV